MTKKKTLNLNLLSENISKLMASCDIDATYLAEQTGLPASTISRLRSNFSETSPNLSSLVPIADFFCVTISQLIGEEAFNSSHAKFKPGKIRRTPVPILSSETISDYLELKREIEAPTIYIDHPISNKGFAYFLQGNAMEPQFPDRTLLIIDPMLELENLDHILVIPSGKKLPLFRQVLIEGEEKYIRTLNPTFNEFTKLTSDSHVIVGVMIESRRNFKYTELPFNIPTKKVITAL